MTIETIQRLTAIPFAVAPIDHDLAQLCHQLARLTRDVPELAEAARLVVLARRKLRQALLQADAVATEAIEQQEGSVTQ